jgi:endoribonuclease LACTB2
MNIVNAGYDSTNYYVLAESAPILLIDAGWPNTLPKFQAACKRMGVDLARVPYVLCTHYHPDHAGLAQELKRMGAKLIVTPEQVASMPALAALTKPTDHFTPIEMSDNVLVTIEESRAFLVKIGIAGEIVHTPGHSDDSVTLVLDTGEAFTGDLTSP